MPTAKEILDYRDKAFNGTLGVYYNDSPLHAAIIMVGLIKVAIRNNAPLNIFCGNFSLFKDSASEEYKDLKKAYNDTDLNDDERSDWNTFNPYDDLISTLTEYLSNNNHKLSIILENDVESLRKESVWKLLINPNVELYRLKDNIGLDHFTVTNKAYRIENSATVKSASGNFDDFENATVLNNTFTLLTALSEKYNNNRA